LQHTDRIGTIAKHLQMQHMFFMSTFFSDKVFADENMPLEGKGPDEGDDESDESDDDDDDDDETCDTDSCEDDGDCDAYSGCKDANTVCWSKWS
jgi:hypothetical protein